MFLFARDIRGRGGVARLRHDTPGASAAYVREGERTAHRIELTAGELGRHTPGGLAEVDARLMPGLYQLGLPDPMLAAGSTRAFLVALFPGAVPAPIDIALVAYDPQDAWSIGVEGLANRRRHEFLRRALPRLTEMELALGEEAERNLASRLASEGGSGTEED